MNDDSNAGTLAILACAVAAVAVSAAFFCLPPLEFPLAGIATRAEVLRLPSPDRSAEIVVVAWDGGATGLVEHVVHVVVTGGVADGRSRAASLKDAHVEPDTPGIRCRWTGNDSVVVEFGTAAHAEPVRNPIEVGGRTVTVTLDGSARGSGR